MLRKKIQNLEEARQSTACADFVEELVPIEVFLIPYASTVYDGLMFCSRKHLDDTVRHKVKGPVLIEGHAVSGNQPPGLQVPRQLVEDLGQMSGKGRATW